MLLSEVVSTTYVTSFIRREYQQLDGIFTDNEAWVLFRLSAYLETFGWMLLITGIVFSHFKLPGYLFVLPIGGSLHGLFVITYSLIVFFAHRSMNWSVKRFIVAELISTFPFAALAFEQWAARSRREKGA